MLGVFSAAQASLKTVMYCRSASFATPAHVRKEWAEEHGLAAFQSAEYDAALEAISKRLGVTTGLLHVLLYRFLRKLHMPALAFRLQTRMPGQKQT